MGSMAGMLLRLCFRHGFARNCGEFVTMESPDFVRGRRRAESATGDGQSVPRMFSARSSAEVVAQLLAEHYAGVELCPRKSMPPAWERVHVSAVQAGGRKDGRCVSCVWLDANMFFQELYEELPGQGRSLRKSFPSGLLLLMPNVALPVLQCQWTVQAPDFPELMQSSGLPDL
eukprot:s3999_g9.t1